MSAADGARLVAEQPLGDVRVTKVGEFVESGLWLESGGERRPLEPRGYVHALR